MSRIRQSSVEWAGSRVAGAATRHHAAHVRTAGSTLTGWRLAIGIRVGEGRTAALVLLVECGLMATGHRATIPLAWLTVYPVGAIGDALPADERAT